MLQIHDELCFNIKDENHANEIKSIMENAIEFKVPSDEYFNDALEGKPVPIDRSEEKKTAFHVRAIDGIGE